MSVKESKWTKGVCGEMTKCNALVFACVGGVMQTAGWPDRYVAHKLWTGWLEFKGEKTRLTIKQHHIIYTLNKKRPGTAYVIRWPNRIEDCNGDLLANFDGHGKSLLTQLGRI